MDFGDEKIAFFEECAHLQLIALEFSALYKHECVNTNLFVNFGYAYLDTSGEVDR